MAKIESPNLLPPSLVANQTATRVSYYLKIIAVLGLETLIVGTAVMLSIIITNAEEMKITQNRIQDLNNSITLLEPTEQKLFLIHDRVGKANKILSDKSTSMSADNLSNLLSEFPAVTTVNSVDIAGVKSNFDFTFKSSSDLAKFLSAIVAINNYKDISLLSLSYS